MTKYAVYTKWHWPNGVMSLDELQKHMKDNIKPSSLADDVVIVNTSRGEIINHSDLFLFLDKNPNAMYCSDVLPQESNTSIRESYLKEFALRSNVIITQHIGGMSSGARKTAFGLACNLLLDTYGVVNG